VEGLVPLPRHSTTGQLIKLRHNLSIEISRLLSAG
jgi:hypothetical protein